MKRWLIPVVAVLVVAVGVGCFFGGRATSGSNAKAASLPNGFPTSGSMSGSGAQGAYGAYAGRGGRGGNMVIGSIIANDGTTITVKTSNGSTKMVLFSGSTTISKTETGSASDLKVGQEVSVTGSTNTDNTVTATRISVGRLQGPAQTQPAGTGAPNAAPTS
jgi:hypothetical protein